MKDDITISEATRARAEEVKRYIEKKYNLNRQRQEERAENWKGFEQRVRQLNLSIEEKEQTKKNILQQEMQELRRRR